MSDTPIEEFAAFLQEKFRGQSVIEPVKKMAESGKPSTMQEVVFNSVYLAPAIKEFFQRRNSPEELMAGLGFEGFANSSGFGSSPALRAKHLFTKSDVVRASPPEAWFQANEKRLTDCNACPDFVIRKPLLPLSILGEVKYLTSGSPRSAVREIYNASRQAVFYLGAFNGASKVARYDSAMIILADASQNGALSSGCALLKESLRKRFGAETGIYFVPITLA